MRAKTQPDVRTIRKKLGFTQEQLGFLLGVTKDTVYQWEKGRPMSPLGRRAFQAFLQQPQILEQLAATMTVEEILAAVSEPVHSLQAHSS